MVLSGQRILSWRVDYSLGQDHPFNLGGIMKMRILLYAFFILGLIPNTGFSEKTTRADQPEVLLHVKGNIEGGVGLQLTMEDLLKLPQASFSVTSRKNGTKDIYAGVNLKSLLEYLKVGKGAMALEVIAENDYKAFIRIEDIGRYDYLLSYKKNGLYYHELEPGQNKGPLAIAIDFDGAPQLNWEVYKHQLVWFVREIIVQ